MTLVSYLTYLDISSTHFEWNQYASKLALARLLTLGFVLMLTVAWSFWKSLHIHFFWRVGQRQRLFVFLRCFGRINQHAANMYFIVEYTAWARCFLGSAWFYSGAFFPSAFCARRSGATAACCVIHAGLPEPECGVQHIPSTDVKLELNRCAPQ